jgi:hypothetical protein
VTTTTNPTPPPTRKAAAEAASEAALLASGKGKVEVTVVLDLVPEALEGMRAAPVAAVAGLGDGMATHLGKPIGTVRVAATVPDLGAIGVFTFDAARRLGRFLQGASLEVSYEVAVLPSETDAMQAQLETTKNDAASLGSLTEAINSRLEAEVGVSVAGASVTSEIRVPVGSTTPAPDIEPPWFANSGSGAIVIAGAGFGLCLL